MAMWTKSLRRILLYGHLRQILREYKNGHREINRPIGTLHGFFEQLRTAITE